MKRALVIIFICLLFSNIMAQTHAPGHIIVWHHQNVRGDLRQAFMERYSTNSLSEEMILSNELNIVLYTFNHRTINEDEMLLIIRSDSSVHLAQLNPYLTYRGTRELIPDDTHFNNQWSLRNTGQAGGVVGADISAIHAWSAVLDIENRNNREVVVAIPDTYGSNTFNHPDVNWYRNETGHCHQHGLNCTANPVHDYWGWNANTNQPLIQSLSGNQAHGLAVAGITGAITDNGTGVASIGGLGVKIMPIHMTTAGSNVLNSEAINAYNYVLAKRTLYNETGGQYGAYIVATNASWGVNNGTPQQYPVWAGLYDLMGEQGIISTGAGPNANLNIDNVGDMPGTVTSPWFLSITNTTRSDAKAVQAGYGAIHVHLGAPGMNIWTPRPNGNYADSGSGTSYAAPQVAGTVGLMYLAATEELLSAYDANPADLALIFRQFILDGVDPKTGLANITVTGGRLNSLNPILSVIELNNLNLAPPDDFQAELVEDDLVFSWSGAIGASYNFYKNDFLIAESIADTTFTDYNVEKDAMLQYKIIAVFLETFESEPAELEIIVPLFNPVSNLEAVIAEDGVVITWDEPETQNYGTVEHYKIIVQTDDEVEEHTTTEPSFTDIEVEADMTYTYIVSVVWGGEIDGESEAVDITIEIPSIIAPTNLSIVLLDDDSVELSWEFVMYRKERINPFPTVFNIYRDDELISTTQETTFTDTNLTLDTKYEYAVTSLYFYGESNRIEGNIIVPIFNPPTNLQGNSNDDGILLSWEEPATQNYGTVIGYTIERKMIGTEDPVYISLPVQTEFLDTDVLPNTDYFYKIIAIYGDEIQGESLPSEEIIVQHIVNDFDKVNIITTALMPNYPNPFNPNTTIYYSLEDDLNVSIVIYNIRGQLVRTLFNDMANKGFNEIVWNGKDDSGRDVSSGVYFYIMKTDTYNSARRMVLMK